MITIPFSQEKIILLKRLHIIKINIKKFRDKWEQKPEYGHWWEKFRKVIRSSHLGKKPAKNEASILRIPSEFRYIYFVLHWAGRFAVLVGAYLIATGKPGWGTLYAVIFLLLEALGSSLKQYYDDKKKKWEEFIQDAEKLWDNYDELRWVLRTFQSSSLKKSQIEVLLIDLNNKVDELLKEYNSNGNEKVDCSKFEEVTRKELIDDLRRNWNDKQSKLEDIVKAIKNLEEVVINF